MFELPGSDVKEFVVDGKYCEEQENNPSNPGLKEIGKVFVACG